MTKFIHFRCPIVAHATSNGSQWFHTFVYGLLKNGHGVGIASRLQMSKRFRYLTLLCVTLLPVKHYVFLTFDGVCAVLLTRTLE